MTEFAAGAEAPRFTLPGRSGGDVAVPGDAPLTFLVVYKASCPTCRWALPLVQSLHEKVEGISVVGVASDTAEDTEAFAAELGLDVELEPLRPQSAARPVAKRRESPPRDERHSVRGR